MRLVLVCSSLTITFYYLSLVVCVTCVFVYHYIKKKLTLQKVFDKKAMITYKRNKNLGQFIGGHTLQGGKVFKTHLQIINGESKSCNKANKSYLCRTQVVNTKTFKSYQAKTTFKIFHKLNCKSSFVIYSMECTLCKKLYVGKAETPFNIGLNNHRKDGNNPKAIPASIHFKQPGHNFNKHAKFVLIEQINNTINTNYHILTISYYHLPAIAVRKERLYKEILSTT